MNDESKDAERVDQAVEALVQGDLAVAERLLLEVVAQTPDDYQYVEQREDGTIAVKFWDQGEFLHYVLWHKQQGTEHSVEWTPNAYARAHYYLGFLYVKQRRLELAIKYLERGQQLQPTQPMFRYERAQALIGLQRHEEALALYEDVSELGPHVSPDRLAVAHRGRGFALIEMQRLEEAEEAFQCSLQLDPGNDVALHELKYIEHLRRGGAAASAESVPTTRTTDLSQCAACGKSASRGVVVTRDRRPVMICKRCQDKMTKKWWQFWK